MKKLKKVILFFCKLIKRIDWFNVLILNVSVPVGCGFFGYLVLGNNIQDFFEGVYVGIFIMGLLTVIIIVQDACSLIREIIQNK